MKRNNTINAQRQSQRPRRNSSSSTSSHSTSSSSASSIPVPSSNIRRRRRNEIRQVSIQDATSSVPFTQRRNSNLYDQPIEIDKLFIENPDFFIERDGETFINLFAIKQWFNKIEGGNTDYDEFYRFERDSDQFLENEIKKMCFVKPNANESWIFPYIIRSNGFTLQIPTNDCFDLPLYIMLYILWMLIHFPHGHDSFTVSYELGEKNTYNIPIYKSDGTPIQIVNGLITETDLNEIYTTIIINFKRLLPIDDNMTWNGSEDSGTRIMLHNYYGRTVPLKLKLILTPIRSVSRGHGWTQQVEDLLQKSIGTSVISVRNKDDNKCLIYCLIMGLILKIKGGSVSRVFGRGNLMVESSDVFSKGTYLFPNELDETDEVIKCIHKLTKLLLPLNPVSRIDDSSLEKFVDDIDKKAGTMISVLEFRKEFSEIETKLIPVNICGIDVYGIDFNINSHIYPLYISKNRTKVIELLCVTPLNTRCSHYCLIVNKENLFKHAGGKQFFSCSKCGESFYHRRLLTEHKCPFQLNLSLAPIEGGYHYSTKNFDPQINNIVGVCSKCRLCFIDQFALDYHLSHCFMEKQTGYRHVQLINYDKDSHPTLTGEEINMEHENMHVFRRRIMYADFESSINKETGEHKFMSYGLYDCESEEYKCGYDIEEFINNIIEKSFSSMDKDQIYVYFHNAMGYDANFVLRHILKSPQYSKWGIQVIMKSMNRLQKLVFHVRKNDCTRVIHIGDTFLFLTLSLDRIVSSIRKDDIEQNLINFNNFFKIFHKRYPYVTDEKEIDHILRKNIFPYKFFDENEKLDTPIPDFLKIFEPREENLQYFSDHVTLEELTKSFNDVRHVIDVFRCESAKDYHDLYLCCDVMELADVFNRSMDILWESHHIHLTNYLGMPSASWAAFLRHDPKMSIPLYEDTFYAEFFKGMIRGGITSAALRYAKADETHSIIYLDVNGLYPYVMQKYKFPCGTFKYIPFNWEDKDICKRKLFELFEILESESKGMCFSVDMIIPDSVKYLTDMYPFAPEHRKIFSEYYEDMETKTLTPFLQKWSLANNNEKMGEFDGLVCTLYNKQNYNVHWRLLKFYLEHGVEIEKVHFAIEFDEGDYLAGYIRKNIEIRNTRKDELGKTLYKLLGNSIYGKTFESPFKRNTFEIIKDPVKLQGMLEEGNIAAVMPIDDYAWIVRIDGEDIILDKPTYIGACVCEFSKLHMYTLLYDKLMKIFPTRLGSEEFGCQLIYTDTDSFIVRVQHPEDFPIHTSKDLFDYIKTKDPELIGNIGGQVKSETGEDDTIEEIIALRSKVYAYKTKDGHLGKRAKGTTHEAQDLQLDWDIYKKTLDTLTSATTHNTQFLRQTFKVSSIDVLKQSLSVNDGKRHICDDGIHTHAFGYPSLK